MKNTSSRIGAEQPHLLDLPLQHDQDDNDSVDQPLRWDLPHEPQKRHSLQGRRGRPEWDTTIGTGSKATQESPSHVRGHRPRPTSATVLNSHTVLVREFLVQVALGHAPEKENAGHEVKAVTDGDQ